MDNIQIGQVAEYFDGFKVVVSFLDRNKKTMGLTYVGDHPGDYIEGRTDRPWSELVDLGEGRIIWNHE